MKLTRVLFIAVLCACKAKDTASTSGSGSAPPGSSAKPAEPGVGAAVTLATGKATLGCIAWSARDNVAACVTGETGTTRTELALSFVGGKAAPVKLGGEIDAAAAAAANTALASGGFAPLAPEAMKLKAGTPLDAGGVKLAWVTKQTHPGGDNQPPTNLHRVTATCGGREVEVFKRESEGHEAEVTAKVLGDRTLVEIAVHIALEGENGEELIAAIVDSSCNVASSAK